MSKIIYVAIISAFVNNLVLSQMYGVNAMLKGSSRISTALRLGFSIITVTFFSSAVTWPISVYVLDSIGVDFLDILIFLLVVGALSYAFFAILRKSVKRYDEKYNGMLPLVVINSAVLGILINNVQVGYSFLRSLANSLSGAFGFAVAVVIMAGIRERIRYNDVPRPFEEIPILLISAGLMAIAFNGFAGLI